MRDLSVKKFLPSLFLLVFFMVICYLKLLPPWVLVNAFLYVLVDALTTKKYGKLIAGCILVVNLLISCQAVIDRWLHLQLLANYEFAWFSTQRYIPILFLLLICILQLVLLCINIFKILKKQDGKLS